MIIVAENTKFKNVSVDIYEEWITGYYVALTKRLYGNKFWYMKRKEKLANVEPVKIPSLFGMRPGKWIFYCYLIILLCIVFFVGMLPGILHGNKLVYFENNSANVAVYLDGKYVGGTPCWHKVASGKHSVQYKIDDILLDDFEIEVGHPIFLTLFFPRKMVVSNDVSLSETGLERVSRQFIQDVCAYSAITSYDSVYKYPPIFERYANTVSGATFSSKILEYAVQFITTEEMLNDAKKAFEILNLNYDFAVIEKAVSDKSFRIKSAPIYGTISGESELSCDKFSLEGYNYDMFNLSSVPVSETLYAIFVENNPEWAISNKESLIKQGLVDENYLADISLSSKITSYKPIRNVSYYAARAFCNWMSEQTGKEVYLPTEIEWTAAASSADLTFNKSLRAVASSNGPSSMFGGVWEYTSTFYVPNDNVIESDIQDFLKQNNFDAEIIVKGGCYASNPSTISIYTIGIVSPFLCSDYYGFRVAWK